MSPNTDNQLYADSARQTSHEECEDTPAPPAIVPRRYGLISMTFFTVPEATCQLRPSHVAEVTVTYLCNFLQSRENLQQLSLHLGTGKQGW